MVYFESTNWTVGALDGYDQTEKFGPIMHSERDNLAFLEANMPDHIEENLSTFSHLLYAALANLDDPNTPEDETPPIEDDDQAIKDIIDDIVDAITEDAEANEVTPEATKDDKKVYITQVTDKEEEAKDIEAERLPDTATSTWVLSLAGVSLVLGVASLKKKDD